MNVHITADDARITLLWMLVAFIATFAITRLVVHLIRSGRGPFGNVEVGSVHVHHLVPGIFLMMISATIGFTLDPHGAGHIITACAFAVGAALTLDEFALWLHLDDVYWTQEGRQSVDAVVYAAGLGLFLFVGSNPFSPDKGESRGGWAVSIVITLVFALIAVFKGRYFLGVAGIVVPFLALVGALRLARPHSPWARRFYKPGSAKLAKAEARAARRAGDRAQRWINAIAGRPDPPSEPPKPPADGT